jgi:uncharacterized protein YkwD
MARGGTWRKAAYLGIGLAAALLLTSCSWREGMVEAGTVPPPDGAQMAQEFFGGLNTVRRDLARPQLPRETALDEAAEKGLQAMEAGVPDGATTLDHIEGVAPLPEDLRYAIGFEPDTPGISEKDRELNGRRSGNDISEALLGADPALQAVGWAARGAWSVFVLRIRELRPPDAAPLKAALETSLQRSRPKLLLDPGLAAIAAEAAADGRISDEDDFVLGRSGGVPVAVTHSYTGPHAPTSDWNATMEGEGMHTLNEPWLNRAGVAVTITEAGRVVYVVLAAGEPDRAALSAELEAMQARAADLVNRARAEAALPSVAADPALTAAARGWAAEMSARGCYVGLSGSGACPGLYRPDVDQVLVDRSLWRGAESAFTFYLAPAEAGDEKLKRFGIAAVLGTDGTVWSVLVFAG